MSLEGLSVLPFPPTLQERSVGLQGKVEGFALQKLQRYPPNESAFWLCCLAGACQAKPLSTSCITKGSWGRTPTRTGPRYFQRSSVTFLQRQNLSRL